MRSARHCADLASTRRPYAKRSLAPSQPWTLLTTCTPAPPTASAWQPPWRAGRSSRRVTRQPEHPMRVELQVNGRRAEVDVEPRSTLLDCLHDNLGLKGTHAG